MTTDDDMKRLADAIGLGGILSGGACTPKPTPKAEAAAAFLNIAKMCAAALEKPKK